MNNTRVTKNTGKAQAAKAAAKATAQAAEATAAKAAEAAAAQAAEATKPVKALTEAEAKEILASTIDYGEKTGQSRTTISRAVFFNGNPNGRVIFETNDKAAKVLVSGDIFESNPDSSFIQAMQTMEGVLAVISYLSIKVIVGNMSAGNAVNAYMLTQILKKLPEIKARSVTCIRDGKEISVEWEDVKKHASLLVDHVGSGIIAAVEKSPLFTNKRNPKKSAKIEVKIKSQVEFE